MNATPYRDGQNVIRDAHANAIVYMPPEAKDVPWLMEQFITWINENDDLPVPIKASIAHYQYAAFGSRSLYFTVPVHSAIRAVDKAGLDTRRERRIVVRHGNLSPSKTVTTGPSAPGTPQACDCFRGAADSGEGGFKGAFAEGPQRDFRLAASGMMLRLVPE